MNPLYKNVEGYIDQTAGKAIKAADRPPDIVSWYVQCIKSLAGLMELEVIGRIAIKDKKTGRIWK